MEAFWQSTFLIGVAELGDKSQLAAIAFAARYSARMTLAGIAVATLIVHLVSTLLGEATGVVLSKPLIEGLTGVAFLGFGLWTLKGDRYEEAENQRLGRVGAFIAIVVSFILAELGDKTMLATITLGSQLDAFVGVWLGSTFGMVVADALAIGAGRLLGRRLPEKQIRFFAALVFLGYGLWTLTQAGFAYLR
jgi:putative Ca2+/H+ antiporter (TMEM165/GDT1 family)